MRKLPFKLERDYARQQAEGMYNAPLMAVIKIGRNAYAVPLSAGTEDDIALYRDSETIYVLSSSGRYGYVGLATFDLADAGAQSLFEAHSVFLEGEEAGEVLKLARPTARIRALSEYCY